MILIPPIQIQVGLPFAHSIVWEEDDVPVNMSSGWTYYDQVHWDSQSQKVAGHTGAYNLAVTLGLTSGSLIGV